MDLLEAEKKAGGACRHPWETSRLKFIKNRLKNTFAQKPATSILDIGSGDGFVAVELKKSWPTAFISGFDPNLNSPSALEGVTIHSSIDEIPGGPYQLATMFDVLEHVENDYSFLSLISERFLESGSIIFLTVPLHPLLFSEHDRFLKHHRRYKMDDIHELAEKCSLEILDSGQFFLLPLIGRGLGKISPFRGSSKGVGGWGSGKTFSALVETALNLDWGLFSGRMPGLSGYAILRK